MIATLKQITILISTILLLACQKEEITVVNRVTNVRQITNQATIFIADTVSTELSAAYDYTYVYQIDSTFQGNILPRVYCDIGQGYQSLPQTFNVSETDWILINYLYAAGEIFVFAQNRSQNNVGSLELEIAILLIETN